MDATFTLAIDQLRETNPAATQLLELCALLAPDEIPLSLLLSRPHLLPEPLGAATADSVQRGEVASVLYQQGLLTPDTADSARMHRLVQDVALAHLAEADRRQRLIDAVDLLAELFPQEGNEPAWWPQCSQLLPHVQAVLDHTRIQRLMSPGLATLLQSTAIYLRERGLNIRLARELDEQALAMYQRLFEGDDLNVADGLANLAMDLTALGEHERARELDEQALAMYQRLLEGDDLSIANGLVRLAVDLSQLGEHERARELDEQALAMYQRLTEQQAASTS